MDKKDQIITENPEELNKGVGRAPNDQGFAYFPTTYRMSTMGKMTSQANFPQSPFKMEKSVDDNRKDTD